MDYGGLSSQLPAVPDNNPLCHINKCMILIKSEFPAGLLTSSKAAFGLKQAKLHRTILPVCVVIRDREMECFGAGKEEKGECLWPCQNPGGWGEGLVKETLMKCFKSPIHDMV